MLTDSGLMPQIQNWNNLIIFRSNTETRYTHIDALFGNPVRNVIDWNLITDH